MRHQCVLYFKSAWSVFLILATNRSLANWHIWIPCFESSMILSLWMSDWKEMQLLRDSWSNHLSFLGSGLKNSMTRFQLIWLGHLILDGSINCSWGKIQWLNPPTKAILCLILLGHILGVVFPLMVLKVCSSSTHGVWSWEEEKQEIHCTIENRFSLLPNQNLKSYFVRL